MATALSSNERTTRRSAAAAQPANSSSIGDEDPFSHLDPTLHGATLNSVGHSDLSAHEQSRLSDFAQHVLGEQHDDAADLLAFGEADADLFGSQAHGFEGLMEAAENSQRAAEANGAEDDMQEGADGVQATPTRGRGRGGRKRRRPSEEMVEGDGDPIRMKKDNHKEVERKRRAHINDGIEEISRLIPGGFDKIGKSTLLKRAADYLSEITQRVEKFDDELAKHEMEKANLQAELALVQNQLGEEQARAIRLETSWREAEDRAAQSQFELANVKSELGEVRKKRGM